MNDRTVRIKWLRNRVYCINDKTFRIEIGRTFLIRISNGYDCHNELHKHLAEAKRLDVDVDISLLLEGGIFVNPNADNFYAVNQIDFFSAIYIACEQSGYDPSRIILWWGNANIKDLYRLWCEKNNPSKLFKGVYYFPIWLWILQTNTDEVSKYFELSSEIKRDKLFTFFVGYEREHRIKTINFLHENNLLNQCEWTWVNSCTTGLPQVLHDLIPKSAEGHKHFTEKTVCENPGEEFFKMYKNTYFDLVTETYYHNDFGEYKKFDDWWESVFFSEKIWRSIMNKRPFLLIGNKHSLRELHNLGFKTFPTMFDESYDSMGNDDRIYHVLNQLKNITIDEVHDKVYSKEVSEAVEHNYNLINSILFKEDAISKRFRELWSAGDDINFCIVENLPYL